MEAAELAHAPEGVVTDVRRTICIQLVSIGAEDGIHVEGIILPPLESDAHGEVAPLVGRGGRVIRHGEPQLVDEAYLFVTERVLVVVALDLHLEVVGDIPADVSRFSLSWDTIERALVRRVFHERDVAVGVRLLISAVVTIACRPEVGCIGEAHTGRDDMTDGHHLVAENLLVGHEEAVELGAGAQREIPVIHVMEAVGRIVLLLLGGRIPGAFYLAGIHAVGEIERGRHVHIVQQGEATADRDAVLYAIAPILQEV